MKKFLLLILICIHGAISAQNLISDLNNNWEFSRSGTDQWYPAKVPGSIYTDLLRNNLIPDPFFSTNEKLVQWVDSCDWDYRTYFSAKEYRSVQLFFEGLDTYADVYLNNNLILQANNMFRGWDVKNSSFVKPGFNELKIHFHSALKKVNEAANASLPLILPDNNRVYARKAQYQFGWDWGPKLIGCGIWKPVELYGLYTEGIFVSTMDLRKPVKPFAKLIQQKDSIGETFYFEKEGKPIYIKGANWIPADIFPANVKRVDYRKLLFRAKNANMNMLRVWGGGIYEDNYFYTLCDSLGIMVWQDFMFAGGMYPADKAYLKNVKEEVKYQVNRLRGHPCIVLWCGNNEIDEAWHHWGWQQQFNLHGADSAKVWQDYKTLFEDSIRAWVKEFDGTRPYISSSPKFGWGNPKSYTSGDSHYWGLWWGLEPWEAFETHTGRFVSEYGMQSMPNYHTVKNYVPANDLHYNSPAVQWHQKANDGFKKLNFYLDKYFIDSSKLAFLSLEEYTYLTQCLQYYILKNSIAIHLSKAPQNMGTLLWQLNDCWPATSWSITDYCRAPKAAWYAVKDAYRDDIIPTKDPVYPKALQLEKSSFYFSPGDTQGFYLTANTDLKYVYLSKKDCEFSDNYFDLKKGERKYLTYHIEVSERIGVDLNGISIITLNDILSK